MKKNEAFRYSVSPSDTGYQNPLARCDAPDPCIRYDDESGYYYGIHTGHTTLTMYRAKRIATLFSEGERRVIYEAKDADGTYGFLWAPEFHKLDGVWYIYTSTHEKGNTGVKHLICLVANTGDPFEGFRFAAHIHPDIYAIDPTVYKDPTSGRLFLCSSVVEGNCQKLAIEELRTPTTPAASAPRVISEPTLDWELIPPHDRTGWAINEGAYFIAREGRLFIVYSANGCWIDDYVFGILELVGEDPLDPAAWQKQDTPFMTKGNGVFGPGHATFFASPSGDELWMCYHALAKSNPSKEPAPRYPAIQPVLFDETGFPHVGGVPLPQGVTFAEPS